MFYGFDGSGRDPRPLQQEALQWIQDTWDRPIVALSAATGVGKAAICRSIQKEFGGYIVVPNNHLMHQNEEDYPEVPALKGAAHYPCHGVSGEHSCEDIRTVQEHSCEGCPYTTTKQVALITRTAFVNPMSFIFLKRSREYRLPPVIIVDEAHALLEMLLLVSGGDLNTEYYGKPSSLKLPSILKWLNDSIKTLSGLYKEAELDQKIKLTRRIEKLKTIAKGLVSAPDLYTINKKGKYVHIKPILPPADLVASFLNATKVVLLSATLSRFDVYDLLQHSNFEYLELDNPIPVENRQILFRPSVIPMNKDIPPKAIASWIKVQMRKFPNRNTIVHLTYKDQQAVLPYFPDALHNTKENKIEVVNEFKQKGGLLLAAACHEGVDLPGDQCRLNLIPKLHKPNLGDPVVNKRRARSDGTMWYKYKTISTCIQQAGRSTRGIDDSSITVIGDRVFKWYISDLGNNISKGFTKAIRWG